MCLGRSHFVAAFSAPASFRLARMEGFSPGDLLKEGSRCKHAPNFLRLKDEAKQQLSL